MVQIVLPRNDHRRRILLTPDKDIIKRRKEYHPSINNARIIHCRRRNRRRNREEHQHVKRQQEEQRPGVDESAESPERPPSNWKGLTANAHEQDAGDRDGVGRDEGAGQK
jgi:hypothetical protein